MNGLALHCFIAPNLRLANDFEAIAHALPSLGPEVLLPLSAHSPSLPPAANFRFAVFGSGTGLSAADKLATALEDGKLQFAQLLGAYILKHKPGVSGIKVATNGEIQETSFYTEA